MITQKYYKIPEYQLRNLLYGYCKWLNHSCGTDKDIEQMIEDELDHGWLSEYEIKPAKI